MKDRIDAALQGRIVELEETMAGLQARFTKLEARYEQLDLAFRIRRSNAGDSHEGEATVSAAE